MSRALLIVLLSIVAALPLKADPRWKIHTTFDGEIDNIFETPEYVYFTSRAMADMSGQRRMSLFRYDKEGDEIQALSSDNHLSSSTISSAQYCPQKGYVVVVETNYDITFLYDDGTSRTIPDYRLASLSSEKTVNSITIDPWHDRLYLATTFGYVAINDEKFEIAESRNYGEDFQYAARVGNHIALLRGNELLYADASLSRLALTDYNKMEFTNPYQMSPISEKSCLIFDKGGAPDRISLLEDDGSRLASGNVASGRYYSIFNNKNGVFANSTNGVVQVDDNAKVSLIEFSGNESGMTSCSYDMTEIWQGKQRKGVRSLTAGSNPSDWTVTRDYMVPNSPSPFATTVMVNHPTLGTLITSYPFNYTFKDYSITGQKLLLSGYDDGWWTNYAPVYCNEARENIMELPNGIVVDPDNPDYVYVTSMLNGILRLNLRDSEDIIHMSKASDADKDNPGFAALISKNQWGCNFSAPSFDRDGNMWAVFADADNIGNNKVQPQKIHIYCWTADDRKASTMSDIRLPKEILIDYELNDENKNLFLALRHSKNRNRLLFSTGDYNGDLVLIDTKGTPTDSSDDVVVVTKAFVDQDGNDISPYRFRSLWEDPSTGNVWVCHSSGVFYFDPDSFFKGGTVNMTRVKISRNDGTNLADYLLDGVTVYGITTDGAGRKWFASAGGLVCTSSDGRTVEEQINTSNSPIPSDPVYGVIYQPSSNSLLMSTSEGIAEYYLTAEAASSGDGNLKIYPNPVRPDYFGYVTIEGLPDRSIVKIVDSYGNIAKEFGPVSGDVQWDVTNHQFKRVSSGVYFVMVSSGVNDSAFATVGKILVVN